MRTSFPFQQPRMNWFDASTGLFLLAFMAGGYLFGMQGMPSLGSAKDVLHYYETRGATATGIGTLLVTIAFFFTFWFFGLVISWLRAAEGEGHLTWISFFGCISFTTVFAAGLAFVLAPAMLIHKGISANTIYLMHSASLLTGVTTAVCGPAFFIPIAILAFRNKLFPRWLAWVTVVAAVGSVTPILGAFSLTGPLNVGNGWIGIHAVAASWVGWSGIASAYFLRLKYLERNKAVA